MDIKVLPGHQAHMRGGGVQATGMGLQNCGLCWPPLLANAARQVQTTPMMLLTGFELSRMTRYPSCLLTQCDDGTAQHRKARAAGRRHFQQANNYGMGETADTCWTDKLDQAQQLRCWPSNLLQLPFCRCWGTPGACCQLPSLLPAEHAPAAWVLLLWWSPSAGAAASPAAYLRALHACVPE
jgi:hypothetical protein